MQEASLLGILFTAFVVGMIHAFDADHVMAVASLSSKKNKFLSILKYSFKWGIGHGGILVVCGLLFIFLGVKLNETLVRAAELSIGIILCLAGVHLLWLVKNKKLGIVEHSHDGIKHVHLVEQNKHQAKSFLKHDHTPVLVGFIHGLAGSAPVIALLPSMLLKNDLSALLYLLLFSLGCLLGMTTFGVLLAKAQARIQKISLKAMRVFRAFVGFGAIGFGIFWLFQF